MLRLHLGQVSFLRAEKEPFRRRAGCDKVPQEGYVPANRLLVVADSKMLPALANGLREGGHFDVLTVPLGNPEAARAEAVKADAVVVFYGTRDRPLPSLLGELAPPLRERGARLIAVLQREQGAQRDECFRNGASEVLFMPMPKDQFVSRLVGAFSLAYAEGSGAAADVSVTTRTSTSTLSGATVTASGLHTAHDLPLKAGESVRVSWAKFQVWGAVVRGGPAARVRFAGLAPDEEVQICDWIAAGAARDSALTPVGGTAAVPAATASASAVSSDAIVARDAVVPGAAAVASASPSSAPDAPNIAADTRAAPASGPPPGFADRRPIRPQTQPSAFRVSPAGSPLPQNGAASSSPALAFPAPATGSAPGPNAAPAPIGLEGLFEIPSASSEGRPPGSAASAALTGSSPPSPTAADAATTPSAGTAPPPVWPIPAPKDTCRKAAFQLLKDNRLPPDLRADIFAATKKVAGLLGSAERAALDKAGPDSYLADALVARVALEAATSEGVKLSASSPAAAVDVAAVASLSDIATAAGARLQKEASQAISKGEVEQLQLVTAASAALSRDMLSFKATADRLRGIGAAPRLGAGALDPDLVLPGQAPKAAITKPGEPAPVRSELRDFKALDRPDTGRLKKVALAVCAVAFAVALVNALFFAMPRAKEISTEGLGAGIARIDVAGKSAVVIVTPEWVAAAGPNVARLTEMLRAHEVENALLTTTAGDPAGTLVVATGRIVGMRKPPAPKSK